MAAIKQKQVKCLTNSEIGDSDLEQDSFSSDSEQNVISGPNNASDSSDSDLGDARKPCGNQLNINRTACVVRYLR
jgi:hypothetical protein